MGHVKTNGGRGTRALLGVCAAALLLLAAVPAQAVPFHPRREALDVTGLNHACGAAVDSKGDLYLSSTGESKVKVYDPSHKLLTSIADSNQPCGLAVTTTGNLYVSEQATGEVVRFKPNAYPFVGTPTYESREAIDSSGKAKGIAVDRTDNRLYVAEGARIALYKADGTFEANLGEGTLTEATGVAAYTYPAANFNTDRYLWVADANGVGPDKLDLFAGPSVAGLKLRRELKGETTPDGSFGFGAAGAYLAADPGNRSVESSEAKCAKVGEQACTAGHLFLYDAVHKALDEFDASGEYLDQAKNAAFADAEPSAVAIDRSGGTNDGTVYVTPGSSAGAKAIAFGPLGAPSRKALKQPTEEAGGLSHVLAKAGAVATDSYGDVYVAAASLIHIYKPDGTEILTAGKAPIEDKQNPWDLAVDSTGKVYVLDQALEGKEEDVTYYTPSAYPPEAGTTYERHDPPIATPKDFPEGNKSLKAIAVDPGPRPGKDRLFLTSLAVTHLYKSAANGSTLLDGEFAKVLPSSALRQSIAVNGANGHVYIGANAFAPLITVLSPDGKEELARIDEAGTPEGPGGLNPFVAVDQTNGHVLEYDGARSTAREYDASGGFIAEFGTFTKGLTKPYRIAIDSACATHEPPLDETTTPTCHSYDPANGTAYVAFDGNAPGQPYDVSAFGPLSYPQPAKHKLTVKAEGAGSGTLTSSPAGINCGATCSAEYLETEVVTLTAKAAKGSELLGWTGCEAQSVSPGEGTCAVTPSKDKEVTATFGLEPAAKFKLTVSKAGSGSGEVTSSPAGIACGLACEAEYEEGTEVTLSASPQAGSTFSGWSGSGCSGTGTCKVTMSVAREVTAEFQKAAKPKFALKVKEQGSGSGEVTSSPAGISCGLTCEAEYEEGTTVTLTGTPGANTKAVAWSGCDLVNGEGKCVVSVTSAREVTATFDLEQHLLTVTLEGTGSGSVTSVPAGIECGATCSASYAHGTTVTLSASPAGSTFAGWTGCDSEPEGKCVVTMSAIKEVTAQFNEVPTFPLAVSKLGAGQGSVSSSPAGIDCGSTCSSEFAEGSTVALTATAEPGSEFRGWSGACAGTGPCEVTMSEAKEVSARFANSKRVLTIEKAPAPDSGGGNGTVSSKPKGIKCAVACSVAKAALFKGAVVLLTAKPAGESTFEGWSGCDTETEGKCTVTMSEAKSVTATFGGPSKPILEAQTLTANKAGTGEGTVKAPGLACEAACTETQVLYQGEITSPKLKAAKEVELSAIPAYGSSFSGWSGAGCAGTGTCVVSMAAARTVTATFTAKPATTLVIAKNSYETGTGTVSSKPKGIKCAMTCTTQTMSVPQGEAILLTEKPATGMEFEGWEVQGEPSACSGAPTTCTVAVSSPTAVKAKFKPISIPPKAILNPQTLTLNKAGDGTGNVKAAGLACEAACTSATSLYTAGTTEGPHPKPPATVTLEAIPSPGSTLSGWTGCEENPEPSKCVVKSSEAKSLTATFDE